MCHADPYVNMCTVSARHTPAPHLVSGTEPDPAVASTSPSTRRSERSDLKVAVDAALCGWPAPAVAGEAAETSPARDRLQERRALCERILGLDDAFQRAVIGDWLYAPFTAHLDALWLDARLSEVSVSVLGAVQALLDHQSANHPDSAGIDDVGDDAVLDGAGWAGGGWG